MIGLDSITHPKRACNIIKRPHSSPYETFALLHATYPHSQIISPWQIQHPRIVLFPVWEVKVEEDRPHDVIHPDWRHRQFPSSKNAIQTGRNEKRRIRIQSVVEQLAQRPGQPYPACLLSVDTVQGVREEYVHGCHEPEPPGDRCAVLAVGTSPESPVVPGEHGEVQHREQEAGKCHHIWGDPFWEVLRKEEDDNYD